MCGNTKKHKEIATFYQKLLKKLCFLLLEHFFVQFRSFKNSIFARVLLVHGILVILENRYYGVFCLLFKNFRENFFQDWNSHLN